MGSNASPNPIIIVGGGCVGLFLALRLAQADPPIPVIVFEALKDVGTESKAMAHQPTMFAEFKRAGIWDDLQAAGTMGEAICFRKTSTGEELAKSAGGPLLLPQYRFQEILLQRLRDCEGVQVLMGHSVTGITDDGHEATVTVQKPDGSTMTASSAHVIGTDGGKSVIRKALDIPFEGETLPAQLIATDLYYPFSKYGFEDANFMIDSDHYGLIGRITRKDLWRVSYGVPAGMSLEDIEKGMLAKFDAMFPGPRPLEYKVDRIAPYKAQQRCASTFRKGRVILAGDAAHLTNPYAGLGLGAGMLDAASLADALIAVRDGKPDSLLDEWAKARKNVFLKFVDPMSRAAYARVQSADPDGLLEKDPMLKAVKAGKKPPPIPLATDIAQLSGEPGMAPVP